MKKQLFMAVMALFVSSAITAQPNQQNRPQAQSGKQEKVQTRSQDRTQAQTHAGTGTQTRTQTGRQEAMQAGYKNNGQMTKARKHARNEERKALKKQQKDLKKQQKQQTPMNSEQYMKQERTTTQNKGARPATPQKSSAKMAKSAGPGGKR